MAVDLYPLKSLREAWDRLVQRSVGLLKTSSFQEALLEKRTQVWLPSFHIPGFFSPGDGEWDDRQRPSAGEMLPIRPDYLLDQRARKTAWQISRWRAESFVPLAVPNSHADEMNRTGSDLSFNWGSASLSVEEDICCVSRLNFQRWKFSCRLQNIGKELQFTSSVISS